MKQYLYISFTLLCLLFTKTIHAQYCTPLVSGPQPVIDSIGLVYFELGSIQNYSAGKMGYENFTGLSTTLKKGREYGYYVGFAVFNIQYITTWIDYDQNQAFNNGVEKIKDHSIFPGFFFPQKFTVPINAVTGATRFRIATNDSVNIPVLAGNCQDIFRGDVEDYTVIIEDTQYVTSLQPFWTSVAASETDRVIFGAELIFTDPTLSAAALTTDDFNFTTNGSTNPATDILTAKLWYTDTIDQFYCHPNPVLLGTINNPTGNLTFPNTNQVIFAAKRNYFWLTYDIKPGAVLTNSIDATFEQVNVGGSNYVPDSITLLPYRKVGRRVSYPHNEANIWYTKTGAGIDFNWEDPAFISDSDKDFSCPQSEGVNTTCDANGNLLFYTDACTIYDRCHNPMPNGQNIIGSSAYTQGLAIPQPGNPDIIYVFTYNTADINNTGYSKLHYNKIDMNMNGGLGDVVAGQKDILLLDSTLQETVGAVNHCNGKDVWVVTGKYDSNEYDAFLITAAGITTTPVKSSPVGNPLWATGMFSDRGILKFSPNGKKMVVTMQSSGALPHLFDFDNTTGVVSNPIALDNTERQAASFSPDNTKLYMGQTLGGQIYQYDMCAANIIASRQFIGQTPSFGCSYIQNAPNGKIYINPGCSSSFLSVIEDPNSLTPTFLANGFELPGTTTDCYTFVSAFNESYFNVSVLPDDAIGFTHLHSCKDSVYFTDTTTATMQGCPGPRTWSWNFGDGNSSALQNPVHHYAAPGTYLVVFTIAQECSNDTVIKPITILSATIQAVASISSICVGDSATLSAFGGNNYQWSPASGVSNPTATIVTVHPTTPTTYTLTGIANNGCADTTIAMVNANQIPVANAGADTIICVGENALLSASGGNTYLWTPTGSLSNSSISTPVATPGGNTMYYVTVSNGPCLDIDSVFVTVLATPTVTAVGTTTIIIGSSTNLSAIGGGNYNWSPADGLNCITCANPIASPTLNTMYVVTVTDASGCTSNDTVYVTVEIQCAELFVPNAFSPNEDGANEILYARSNCIKYMRFEIFNRWGEKVFETTDINVGWNGIYNGERLDAAVFSYVLKASMLDNTEVTKHGNITLVR